MNRDIEYEIRRNYKRLRPSERKVADYLLRMNDSPENLTMTDLARFAGISQPTIMRFANTIGCRGFRELKQRLLIDYPNRITTQKGIALSDHPFPSSGLSEQSQSNPAAYLPNEKSSKLDAVPLTVVSNASRMLQSLLAEMSPIEYKKLISKMAKAKHIVLVGEETSGFVVEELSSKLKHLELHCTSYNVHTFQMLNLSNLTQNDIIVFLSCAVSPAKTTKVLQYAAKSNAALAVLVNRELPALKKLADISIVTTPHPSPYENSIYSVTSQLSLVEMIYAGLLCEKTGRISDDNFIFNQ